MDELEISKMLASDMTPIEQSKLIDELASLRKVARWKTPIANVAFGAWLMPESSSNMPSNRR